MLTWRLSGSRCRPSRDVPTLLLWGAQDRAVLPASIHQLQSRLKNSALTLMLGVGHLPYEEVPAEFDRMVTDFLLHDTPKTPLEMTAGSSIGVVR